MLVDSMIRTMLVETGAFLHPDWVSGVTTISLNSQWHKDFRQLAKESLLPWLPSGPICDPAGLFA